MQLGLASVLFFVAVGVAVPLLMLTLGRLVRPRVPDPRKLAPYECGEVAVGEAWFNFNPRFYLVAIVFLVFDVEVAFTFPVATVFRRFVALGDGALAFAEILAFIGVVLLGLAYVWRHGDLEWVRRAVVESLSPTVTKAAGADGIEPRPIAVEARPTSAATVDAAAVATPAARDRGNGA